MWYVGPQCLKRVLNPYFMERILAEKLWILPGLRGTCAARLCHFYVTFHSDGKKLKYASANTWRVYSFTGSDNLFWMFVNNFAGIHWKSLEKHLKTFPYIFSLLYLGLMIKMHTCLSNPVQEYSVDALRLAYFYFLPPLIVKCNIKNYILSRKWPENFVSPDPKKSVRHLSICCSSVSETCFKPIFHHFMDQILSEKLIILRGLRILSFSDKIRFMK